MKITELMNARAYLAPQREATRILQTIMDKLDVRPMPDGTVRFAFEGDIALLDRLSMWGCTVEEVEGERTDDEDGADREPDGRDLEKLRDIGLALIDASEPSTLDGITALPGNEGLLAA